tara:strand:+ start:749 stop:1363 length:615 start_codon:yes stop_codon:yes gene_type:complete
LTASEIQKEIGKEHTISKDLDLLVSQSLRCREILKKLSLNPNVEDKFIDADIDLYGYINEIVRSYEEISNKNFYINNDNFNKSIKIKKSVEVIYGLRNFIGNANKYSRNKVEIFITSNNKFSNVLIKDDGPGFPKDLIDRDRLGEPYIRTVEQINIKKFGLGLGTFIGKTLLEKNFASIKFNNSSNSGAEVSIEWRNEDLEKIN